MKRAVYYDIETTGIKPEKDRIIEIAAYDPQQQRSFAELVNPGMAIPAAVQEITHIDDAMVAPAAPFAAVARRFVAFCGPDPLLIAHNNDGFDRHFLTAEFQRCQLAMPQWEMFDTLKWARKYRPDLPRHALQSLRQAYGIDGQQTHRALDDAKLLHCVFNRMIDDLTIEEVIQLLQTDPSNQRMPFGKHRGKLLTQVPQDYIRWLEASGCFDQPGNQQLLQGLQSLGLLPEKKAAPSPA